MSTSINVADQQDIVRSILILQQQQKQENKRHIEGAKDETTNDRGDAKPDTQESNPAISSTKDSGESRRT